MSKKNMTRRALFASVISLILCCAMLVGTTFAWFTDSVTSGKNQIVAGNLDIELYWSTDCPADSEAWTKVDANTNIFEEGLWEPGHTEVVYLQIRNEGTLNLKYMMGVNVVSEEGSINKGGNPFKLSDYIQYGLVETSTAYADRAAAVSNVTNATPLANKYSSDVIPLVPGATKTFAMVVYMPETVGNEANHRIGEVQPTILLGLNVQATQVEAENDSFGDDYDADTEIDMEAAMLPQITNLDELKAAIEKGGTYALAADIQTDENLVIIKDFALNGAGHTLSRADGFIGTLTTVKADVTLTLKDITLDGGAVWSNGRTTGSTNTGVTATGNLIATEGNGSIVLEKNAIVQNNDGVNAISLATRGGGSLTVNGAQIINNRSAAGAIWGGGNITINEGSKINYNHATSIGGAIRMVDGKNNITFTMNGGEMNYNTSDGTGGAIWGGNYATYIFNGGEMAYNSAASAGGAIWTGKYEKYYFNGDFKLHDNTAGELTGAVRFCDHTSLTMTGGSVYSNSVNGVSNAFYLNNNAATITGGSISDDFSFSGGLGLTMGNVDMSGVVAFNLSTNHNTANLTADFNGFKFTVNEGASNFSQFNLKPAEGYTYTAGDEAKLVCMNEGYETYWDAATGTFRLQAK